MGCRWTGCSLNTNKTPITDLDLYVKPEERVACYVVNGKFNGIISFQ